ncbi:Orotidine 5'-phosphate decarboxylase [Brevinematales bacterium NS]|nr:Orotidine 5'-phosphate decarboxylase [Brevinematales bacterium NS]
MKTELIVALDVPSRQEAINIVEKLSPLVVWYKVGSILFTKEGEALVKALKDKGCKVFLDLKFFDIPNTVKGVCEVVAKMGVDMFTLHMLGGREMVKAALEGISPFPQKPLALGVTILTSMNETTLHEDLRIQESIENTVSHLVKLGLETGMQGFVCSPHELSSLRSWVPENTIFVTPGVRLPGEATGDQKRVMTPKEAHQNGANYIVMGRSVYGSSHPLQTVERILSDIES